MNVSHMQAVTNGELLPETMNRSSTGRQSRYAYSFAVVVVVVSAFKARLTRDAIYNCRCAIQFEQVTV